MAIKRETPAAKLAERVSLNTKIHGQVKGLGDMPLADQPPMLPLLYYTFRVMAGIGFLFMVLAFRTIHAIRKARGSVDALLAQRKLPARTCSGYPTAKSVTCGSVLQARPTSGTLLPAIFRAYRTRRPVVVLSPEQSNTPSLVAGLLEERVDAAFFRPPIESADELDVELLVREDMMVVLPHSHPLARAGKPVFLSALAEETFLRFPRTSVEGLYDAITSACQRGGFLPRLGPEAPQIVSSCR